ncbi:MAG: hypothetical protein NUW01_16280, partial [Gemmatimonadaceae bacterium]|nr:hypothetical protein [Gemmatimonadaceae bacterium]
MTGEIELPGGMRVPRSEFGGGDFRAPDDGLRPDVPGLEAPAFAPELKPSATGIPAEAPVVAKLKQYIKDSKAAQKEFAEQVHANRVEINAKLEGARAIGAPPDELRKIRAQLKAADEVPVNSAVQFTPDDIREIAATITQAPELRGFETVDALDAFTKIASGSRPTKGEIELLKRVFPDLAHQLEEVSRTTKAWRAFVDVTGLPRAFLSSFDMSGALRQGAYLVGRKQWWTNLRTYAEAMVRKPEYASEIDDWLKGGRRVRRLAAEGDQSAVEAIQRAHLRESAGLDLADFGTVAGKTAKLEESFPTRWASKLPFISRSERGYVTFLNKIRADTFDSFANSRIKAGITGKELEQDLQQMASWVNIATGRGAMPRGQVGEALTVLANRGMWAPRLAISRFEAPVQALRPGITSAVRKQMIRDYVAFFGAATSALTLLEVTGVATVNLNPTSSDFGKAKIGNIRLDPWAGEQQVATFLSRMANAAAKGEIDTFHKIGWKFLRTKFDPAVGALVDVYFGENVIGERVSPSSLKEKLIPLYLQDMWSAFQEEGVRGALTVLPGFFGVGTQTYESPADARTRIEEEMGITGIPSAAEERTIRDRLIAEGKYVQKETTAEEQLPVAREQREEEKATRETELRQAIESGADGADLTEAIRDFKFSSYIANRAIGTEKMTEFFDQFKSDPKALKDALGEAYWGVPVNELPDGTLDFATQKEIRGHILAVAKLRGVSLNYITGTGADTFRGTRFDDPVVASAVLAYEQDMESLDTTGFYAAKSKSAFILSETKEAREAEAILRARGLYGSSMASVDS